MAAPEAIERGPFSFDSYTLNSTTAADVPADRSFDLTTRTTFDPDINETIEVLVGGVKLLGSGGTATTGGGDEFFVDSITIPTKVTIVPNATLLALTPSSGNGSTVTTLSVSDKLVIRRISNRTSKNVDYAPGSVIREVDLDSSNTQIIHVAQEAMDTAILGMVLEANDKFDSKSKVIENVANGVADNDAVNKVQLAATEVTTLAYRDTTLAYREDTEDYKLETADWATKTGSVVNTYTDNVAQADGEDYSAKEYAIGTTVAVGSAKDWAVLAEDSVVTGSSYSALHHAAKALASASAGATSATASAASATASTGSSIAMVIVFGS